MTYAIETPVEGKNAIINFLIDSTQAVLNALPDGVLEKLRAAALEPSPVVSSVNVAELIYAQADELPPELLAIGVGLATMAGANGFHGMAEDGRGAGMAKALKAKAGVSALLPKSVAPKGAPEPKSEFMAVSTMAVGEVDIPEPPT